MRQVPIHAPMPACTFTSRCLRKLLFAGLITGLSSLLVAQPALAVGLGTATTASHIGGPLRIEIPMQASDADRIELSCFRVIGAPSGYSDDVPWLGNARLTIESGPEGALLVVTARPTSQPVIMLGVRIECGVGLRRDYTLLLDPPKPDEISPPAFASKLNAIPAAEPVRQRTPASGHRWQVQAGDSARNIAERVLPGDHQTQRQFALALLRRNAALLNGSTSTRAPLPAGTELELPSLPAPSATALRESNITPVLRPDPVAVSPSPRPAKAGNPGTTRNRLFVSGSDDNALRMSTGISQRKELSENQRSRLRTEMQLIASLDEKIATQIELSERLRQLEAMQDHLKQDAARLEAELQSARAQQRTSQSSDTALSAQTLTPPESPTQQASQSNPVQKASGEPLTRGHAWETLLVAALTALITALGVALWHRRRQGKERDNDLQSAPAEPAAGTDGAEHLIDPISEADIWPDTEGRAPAVPVRSMNVLDGMPGNFTASASGQVSPLLVADDHAEEHDSAIELAEIMMSFGRVHGAAQTLAEFIRSHPKQAVKPWIKLLDVYRTANMRVEFDALTTQLNKTFNVKSISWDAFDAARQAPESLEDLPHIVSRLNELWGKRECQAYLHGLLRDNRRGTRQGFPLAIVDEILMLLGVLQNQIGVYRPDPLPDAAASLTSPSQISPTLNIAPVASGAASQSDLQQTIVSTPQLPPNTARPAPSAGPTRGFSTESSQHQLDFELDMTNLSRTLHLNLDELDEDGGFIKDSDPI